MSESRNFQETKESIDMLHQKTRASTIVAMASCLALVCIGCRGDKHEGTTTEMAESAQGEHPEGAEHPKGEHPKGEHPKGEHPKGEDD